MNTDAIIVGSGPNGLAAAITLARAGLSVTVYEAADEIGGGARSAELTLPSFVHDVCSAVHPLAPVSRFFRELPLKIDWVSSPVPLAHPLEDGNAVLLNRSLEALAEQLGAGAKRYHRFMGPLVSQAAELFDMILGPLARPNHPGVMARFGGAAILPARTLAQLLFTNDEGQALFAGIAAHSFLPLTSIVSSAPGLALAVAAHSRGWPFPCGGSQAITRAMAEYFESLGGTLVLKSPVSDLADLPEASAYLLDVSPRSAAAMVKDRFPERYKKKLLAFRHGPGVFKLDWALSQSVPWESVLCKTAATIHLGGRLNEIQAGEEQVSQGKHPEHPFVLLTQPSLFDTTRAPPGKHTLWGYCHVPNGSNVDMTERIEAQIERFAPGFNDCILARHAYTCAQLETYNQNLVGGDITGGAVDWRQLFIRPARVFSPYSTPAKGIYLCSASTPPGPGVHGMCGYHAAHAVLRDVFRLGKADHAR